jgi:glucose/arabinose dehydrogenase
MSRRPASFVVSAALLAVLAPAARGGPTVDPRFEVTTFATGLNFPKSMTALADGSLLVATSDPNPGGHYFDSTGTLRRLVDADHNGQADGPGTALFTGLPGLVTSVRRAGNLVFATSSQGGAERISVLRAGANPSDPLSLVGSINFTFPADWSHTTFALAVRETPGGSGRHDVFFNIGARGNEVNSTDTVPASGLVNATLQPDSIYMVSVDDSGGTPVFSGLTQVATGLRNAAGIAFDPASGDLYFAENGIDGLIDANEPLSADELNRIVAAEIGGAVEDFGFGDDYIEYRTGVRVGSGAIQPLVAFQPVPPPDGSENEGPAEIAFAPAAFEQAGFGPGVFVGFHGKFNEGGLDNEENPLVFYDLATGTYSHFIGNGEPDIGHLDGLLATADSLFVADLSSTGSLFSPDDAGRGVVYQIRLRPAAVPEPSTLSLLALGAAALGVGLARKGSRRSSSARVGPSGGADRGNSPEFCADGAGGDRLS